MNQLFQNLVSNAIKFRKADVPPEIIISFEIKKGRDIGIEEEDRLDDDFCVLYVKDNGIGFSPEYNQQIFVIFQRLNNNANYSGTGIGLAICKKIVERHNGYVFSDSMENMGSLFTVILPVCQAVPVSVL
jgi:signal transduction histidine kinase